jgi:hypothetical protein
MTCNCVLKKVPVFWYKCWFALVNQHVLVKTLAFRWSGYFDMLRAVRCSRT